MKVQELGQDNPSIILHFGFNMFDLIQYVLRGPSKTLKKLMVASAKKTIATLYINSVASVTNPIDKVANEMIRYVVERLY